MFELALLALQGLRARLLRTVIMMLGPAIGVAALIAVVGVTSSATGELRRTLDELGTNPIVIVPPGGSLGDSGAELSSEAVARARAVTTVDSVSSQTRVTGVSIAGSRHSSSTFTMTQIFEVWVTDQALPGVARADMTLGRFLNDFDEAQALPVVVLGDDVARALGVFDLNRSILLNDESFGIVGVLESSTLIPRLNRSVFVTEATAARLFGPPGAPSELLVRAHEGTTAATADLLPRAITYGAPGTPSVRVPSELIEASAQVDQTLRIVLVVLAGLALTVGAIGIANVMTISVMERSAEIGIRRAMGYTRAIVAAQFIAEAALVGLLGAIVGAVAGIAFIIGLSIQQGWLPELDLRFTLIAGLISIAVAVIAGAYPALRAAGLEPLDALRA